MYRLFGMGKKEQPPPPPPPPQPEPKPEGPPPPDLSEQRSRVHFALFRWKPKSVNSPKPSLWLITNSSSYMKKPRQPKAAASKCTDKDAYNY